MSEILCHFKGDLGMSDQGKAEQVEHGDEFAKRRRALLKTSGKLAVAAPAVTLLLSSHTASAGRLTMSPNETQ